MPVLSVPAFGPRTAIIYVTVGLLIDVWTGVWYFAFGRPAGIPMSNTTAFWLGGFFLTGVSLIGVGLFLGPLGRAARRAELPPVGTLGVEAEIQRTAAATPAPVVAPAPAAATPVAVSQPVNNATPAPLPKAVVLGS